MSDSKTFNPACTNGFEFLEFASLEPEKLYELFTLFGFTKIGQHKQKAQTVELWQQNDIKFIINSQPNSAASKFAEHHGPGTCGMAFRVKDKEIAYKHCVSKGGKPFGCVHSDWCNPETLPVIYGIGDSALYFVDNDDFYKQEFDIDPQALEKMQSNNTGLTYLDHVTHNVKRGNMDTWANFYENLFNFREIRYFDIEGKLTGLLSRAMAGPCSKLRIPINESSDDKSQIEEFLREFNGEGIQHIAMGTDDIYKTVAKLSKLGLKFLHTPDTYYNPDKIDARVPEHGESLDKMKKYRILIDGAPTPDGGRLLQIFTDTVIGPVFFEIIQRKGYEGFGEGNFRALFESIEADQIERGVL